MSISLLLLLGGNGRSTPWLSFSPTFATSEVRDHHGCLRRLGEECSQLLTRPSA